MNRLARERSPYLLQHAGNPVDWYPWGDEAFERRARREQADLPVDRLLDLPLVPRDGARVVREPGDRRRAQPRLRVDQGRSRGAARRRSRLHGVRAGDDRLRRLADERVPHARAEAVLRRHLLSADVAVGPARLHRSARRARARLAATIARRCDVRRGGAAGAAASRSPATDGRSRADGAVAGTEALDAAVEQFQMAFDRRHGGFGDAPKFPRPSELLFLLREHARRKPAGWRRRRRC